MSGMQINVDEGLVKPIIQAEIEAAIVRELIDKDEVIKEIVRVALTRKVDSKGETPGYARDGTYTYIGWLCHRAIKHATKEAIARVIESHQKEIELEIEKQIMTSKDKWVKSFLVGMSEAIESRWRFSINVQLPED